MRADFHLVNDDPCGFKWPKEEGNGNGTDILHGGWLLTSNQGEMMEEPVIEDDPQIEPL